MNRRFEDPIAQMIKISRTHHGMTQAALAKVLATASGNQSISRDQITRWEGGRRVPGPYWRGWLSVVLGVPRNQLDRAAAETRAARLLSGTTVGTTVARWPESGLFLAAVRPDQDLDE